MIMNSKSGRCDSMKPTATIFFVTVVTVGKNGLIPLLMFLVNPVAVAMSSILPVGSFPMADSRPYSVILGIYTAKGLIKYVLG
jgi:hypothetical protein